MDIEFTDNADQIRAEFKQACKRAMESCGETAESYAKLACRVVTGALRNSIAHRADETTCYVGTDQEYAAYVELGTGVYSTTGGGTRGWWVYVKGGTEHSDNPQHYTEQEAKRIAAAMRSRGLDAYCSEGQRPHPYLKPAVADHTDTYRNLIDQNMRNG